VLGTLLILANVLGLAAFSLYHSWQQYEGRLAVQTQNLTQSLNLTLTGILDKSSVAVFSVKKELERQLRTGKVDAAALQEYLLQHKARLPILDGLRVADASGNIIFGDRVSPGSRANIAHRDYFRQLRDNPAAGFVITKPLLGLISKVWVFQVATRVENPDGSFAGVAYATISLDYLYQIFASFDLGHHGVINLRYQDLDVVVRYPDQPGHKSAGSHVVSRELQALVQAGKTRGTYRTKGSVDQVERLISFQKLGNYPLFIAVGLSVEDYFRPWRAEMKGIVLLTALFAGILFVSARILYRGHLRKDAANRTLGQYQEHLEQTVHQRTAELEEKNRQLADEIQLRRQAEIELQKAAVIMQKMSDAVLWVAADGRILYANDAACRLHGYPAEELYTKSVPDIAVNFDPARWREHWQALKRERTLQIETVNRDRNGREFPVEVTANYLMIEGEEFNCGILRDLSERREAEAEKQALMQQLFQAQKIESVGRLAGGIAHDFNNLLTPILGYAELMKQDLDPENKQYRRVDLISQAGDKAKVLIKQLLGFGRQQVLELKTLDVNEVVRGFYEILRRTIRENIEIRLALCPESHGVRADLNQLEQVIMNLAVNAQDAIFDKGTIRIETERVVLDPEYARQHAEVTPGEYLMLAVIDNGCGMDQEVLSHIFEPFFTTKERGKGTGLGLATIYGLVKQHKGHLWVGSLPGKGSTFRVYLPICGTAPQQEAPAPAPAAPVRTAAGECRLLLVEDSSGVRDMVRDLLQSAGYHTLVAQTPEEALQLAHRHPVDLLLSDVVMPDMNGPELYRELLKIQPQIKVLYMSGYTFNAIVHNGELDEGIHFLQKPFAVAELTEKIDAIMNTSS